MIRKILFLVFPLVFALACGKVEGIKDIGIFKPRAQRQKVKPPTPKYRDVFNAPLERVWTATLQGVEWMRWAPAFLDKKKGIIRLKEAYVYRRDGKIIRSYKWPRTDILNLSRVDDYVSKVAIYTDPYNPYRIVFTQESMVINVNSLSASKTGVVINYRIRPYLGSGRFGEELRSSGYIESRLLQKIREKLGTEPLAKTSLR
ncbi:MAG: hypothetical protein KatS3mg078_1981 [Deltaproteobacteria bacterium]|jgi:hypothetical protein|nr:MAG: hypothetical protein KatS3mg078_1981 [Deltaproteobacteria bacterium]